MCDAPLISLLQEGSDAGSLTQAQSEKQGERISAYRETCSFASYLNCSQNQQTSVRTIEW